MKIHFFGSGSSVAPIYGVHHTAFAVEYNGVLYWFDAGEGCAFTAQNMNLDLLNIKKIFISHSHMDHVGGLGGLMWLIRKLTDYHGRMPLDNSVEVFIPNSETWDGCMKILQNTEGNFECKFDVSSRTMTKGIIYCEDGVSVEALPNNHIKDRPGEAYSFVFETAEKRIIYSGDMADISDIDLFLERGCDVLLVETGHHTAEEICKYLLENKYKAGKIIFMHHGRKMLSDREAEIEKAKVYYKNEIIVADDAQTYDI